MARKVIKIISLLLCFLLIFEQSGFAQMAGQLDISGHLAGLRNAFTPDVFRPLHLRYLSYNPSENNFQLFLDKGSLKNPKPQELEETTKTLLNYFFIGLSLPNDTFWVNLRPDSPDNIIDEQLAQTDIGKIMLETDLQLKKDTAKFTSPETPEGREYWDKLYRRAGEIFGSENITIPTLTRPWIVPDEIIIRETTDSAYIYKATLKVMLEQDYLKDSATYNFKDERLKELNEYSSQLIREIIIPKLTKEVNSSKRYASLRQVYYSLIMAQWFKARHKGLSPKGTVPDLIDSRNLTNLASKETWSKTTYFKEYQKSFKDGEYNIQEPVYTPYGQVIRSYFSGGISGIAPATMPDFGGSIVTDTQTGAKITSVPTVAQPVLNSNVIDIQVKATYEPGEVGEIKAREKAGASSPIQNKSGKIIFAFNYHRTIENYQEMLESMIKEADIIILEEPDLFNDLYQKLSEGSLGPDEVIAKMKESATTILDAHSFEMLRHIYSQVYGKGKVIYGEPQIDSQTEDLFARAIELSKNLEEVIIQGDLEKAIAIYKDIQDKLATYNAERDLAVARKLEIIRKQFPLANILVIRGLSHTPLYHLMAKQVVDINNLHQQFFYPNGQPIFGLYDTLALDLSMQKLGLMPQKESTKLALAQALISILLINSMTEEQRRKIDFTLLNRIASGIENIGELEDLFRIIKHRRLESMSDVFHIIHIWMSAHDKWTPQEYTDLFSWRNEPVRDEKGTYYDGGWFEVENSDYLGRVVEPHGHIRIESESLDFSTVQLRSKTTGEIVGHGLLGIRDRFFNKEGRPYNSVADVRTATREYLIYRVNLAAQVEAERETRAGEKGDYPTLTISDEKLERYLRVVEAYNSLKYMERYGDPKKSEGAKRLLSDADRAFSDLGKLSEQNFESAGYPFDPKKARVGQIFITETTKEVLIYEGRHGFAAGSGYSFRHLANPTRHPYIIFDKSITDDLESGRTHPFDLLKAATLKNIQLELPPPLMALLPPSEETMLSANEKEPVETIKKDKGASSPLKFDTSDYIFREFVDNQPMQFSKDKISKINSIDNRDRSLSSRAPGGIDFRSLPIVTQAIGNLSANISYSAIHNLISINLDEEWRQIERMANSGITPSSERIKEYIQTSCAQDNITQDRDKILLCISDILRQEEERCDHTNATLKDILVVLEAGSSPEELKEIFLGKEELHS